MTKKQKELVKDFKDMTQRERVVYLRKELFCSVDEIAAVLDISKYSARACVANLDRVKPKKIESDA